MSNAVELTKELTARCNGRRGQCGGPEGGTHRQCRVKTTRLAAMYHFKLCRAIIVRFRRQLQSDGKRHDGFFGMLASGMENCKVLPVLQFGYFDQIFEVSLTTT